MNQELIEAVLVNKICDVLGEESIDTSEGIMNFGLSSIELAQIALKIQQEFSVDLDFELFYENPSVAALAKLLSVEAV